MHPAPAAGAADLGRALPAATSGQEPYFSLIGRFLSRPSGRPDDGDIHPEYGVPRQVVRMCRSIFAFMIAAGARGLALEELLDAHIAAFEAAGRPEPVTLTTSILSRSDIERLAASTASFYAYQDQFAARCVDLVARTGGRVAPPCWLVRSDTQGHRGDFSAHP